MRQPTAHQPTDQAPDAEKVPFVVVKKIREAILDEVFKPGDRLTEAELVEKFEVSRSPIREALLALEKEGTMIAKRSFARGPWRPTCECTFGVNHLTPI
jgi:DNA-binding GntR family transcriptional regulator